uniref:V-set and transmembrane domain-containing protein 2B-like isoform X2 n=1 Tax=Myxine glutinosa TaxID=7769 RepID=UPI0035901C99
MAMSIALTVCLMAHVHLALGQFTNVPRDVSVVEGEDVILTCAYQGAGRPAHSIEMQWWHVRDPDRTAHGARSRLPSKRTQVVPKTEATKISAIKVMGSNISNYLQLSHVRKKDEGLYECRVNDRSGGVRKEHKAQARLRIDSRLQGDMQAQEARPLMSNGSPGGRRAPAASVPTLRSARLPLGSAPKIHSLPTPPTTPAASQARKNIPGGSADSHSRMSLTLALLAAITIVNF